MMTKQGSGHAAVLAEHVHYRYGRTDALRGLDLSIPSGAFYALLGPNGAGKTTLLQLLMGIRRPSSGHASVLGTDVTSLTANDRARIGYVAEGQQLPRWMRLEEFESFLAPLYPTWDRTLANQLRDRFDLDPRKKLGAMSRGQYMKAALLCALAPRPQLLLLDEPFTGIDVRVKDELVRGLLDSIAGEGWTVVLSSHDVGELETLADWVGFLDNGRMQLSEPMEAMRERFIHVDVVAEADVNVARTLPERWMSVERAGRRLAFVVDTAHGAFDAHAMRDMVGEAAIETRGISLRELFLALSTRSQANRALENVS